MTQFKGLLSSEIKKLRTEHGFNEITQKKEFSALKILIGQFKSFLIIILIFAGSLSLFLDETIDAIAIFAIVLINAFIGFSQEYKAENAVKALKKMVVPKTIVLRDGKQKEIAIRELLPGDIVILNEGDKIPADLKILESFSLKVDESILTGESMAVNKEKEDKLFKGTIITSGRSTAIVEKIGDKTEFGKIIKLVSKQEKTRSPLTIQMDNLGKKLGIIILILIAILFILGLKNKIEIVDMLFTTVALGVSAIPEGMPIIVTLTLAMGVQILARKKAIVRKMNAIEGLGATTVICSDKTGTLTLNEMTVKKIYSNNQETEIPGLGYKYKKVKTKEKVDEKLLEIAENCNNSFIGKDILGDPTEIALKILTRKIQKTPEYEKIDELVFTSDRKMMSTLHKIKGKKEIFSKGAHEEILKRCTHIKEGNKIRKINKTDIKKINSIAEKYSKEAFRVLALAYKEFKNKFDEKDLIFVGLSAMIDPPRKTVKNSIEIAQKAGIKVKIITGDYPLTAKAIGNQIGLKVENMITGEEIDKLSDKKLIKIIEKTQIFARTKPEHKYRIVDLLQKHGEVVAVTGDGVNDAPALKHSDVGIAMGIKGTEATKEVADIVLKDDNFTTIVNTIKEGRRIYHNILAFIKFMLSANFDTIMVVGLLSILGFPLPILALQVLWINIATDALPALALGKSEASKDLMKEKPHKKHEKIFKKFALFIIVAVAFQTISNASLFLYGLHLDNIMGVDITDLSTNSHARTLIFTEIVVFELFLAFVCKEEKSITLKSLKSNKYLIGAVSISFLLQLFVIYTPFMQKVFKTAPLALKEWIIIFAFALTAFLVPSTVKHLKNLYRKIKSK